MRLFGIIYENGKLTTGFFFKRISRIPLIGRPLYRRVVAICGARGHTPGGDWGFGGGETVDSWCRWCDHYSLIPKSEASRYFPDMRTTVWNMTGQTPDTWRP